MATTNVADRVANGVQSPIADIAEGRGMAECGAVIPPAVGVISGVNPRSGEAVAIPAKRVPHFKPGKALREAVDQRTEELIHPATGA